MKQESSWRAKGIFDGYFVAPLSRGLMNLLVKGVVKIRCSSRAELYISAILQAM